MFNLSGSEVFIVRTTNIIDWFASISNGRKTILKSFTAISALLTDGY